MVHLLLASSSDWVWPAELAKDLVAAGLQVAVVGRPGSPLLQVEHVQSALTLAEWTPFRSLARALEVTEAPVVIPCDDRTTWYLRRLYAGTERYCRDPGRVSAVLLRSLGPAIRSDSFIGRVPLLDAARDEGIPVAASVSLRGDGLNAWEKYPAYVKMDGTVGGLGVAEVVDRAAARRAIRRFNSLFRLGWHVPRMLAGRHAPEVWDWLYGRDHALSIQAKVSGHPANMLVCCRDGLVLATIAVEVRETLYPNGPACKVEIVRNQAMNTSAAGLIWRLGLSGFVGLDFIIEKATNQPFLIEMNPRPTGLVRFAVADAPDPIASFCREFLGVNLPPRPVVPIGTVLMLPSSTGRRPSSTTDRARDFQPRRGAEA